jgi:triacylglycerol lipase
VAQADHLDIIGHHGGAEDDPQQRFDWLATRSNFRTPQFEEVWGKVVAFIAQSESMAH